MLRVFTSFSGYDSQCMALDRLGIEYDLVGWSDIDRFAIQAHNAVYPQYADRNLGDISMIDWAKVADFDLFTYSSPCQDFSSAGMQRGGEKGSGTRSSLLWECEKAIAAKRPKYLLMENVAALVSDKFVRLFNRWQHTLEDYGYTNFVQVLNAKDYGVPQNRERVFMVSVLGCDMAYYFPKPIRLEKRLKDVLEQNVDERYYLSAERLAGVLKSTEKEQERGNGFAFNPKDGEDVACTIQTSPGNRKTDNYLVVGTDGKFRISDHQWGLTYTEDTEVCDTPCANGYKEPYKVAEPLLKTDNQIKAAIEKHGGIEHGLYIDAYNESASEISGTIKTTIDSSNMTFASVAEPTVLGWSRDEKGNVIDSHPVNVANCVTVAKRDTTQNFVVEPAVKQIGNIVSDAGFDNPQRGRVYSDGGVSPTLNGLQTSENSPKIAVQNFRIRKLTERECFRLMDVSESDIDKIQRSGVSRSQQYKMAGNSIVVAVLAAIFDKLLIHNEPDNDTQLKIF